MEQTTWTWTLSRVQKETDFPYRILITGPGKPLLNLRAKGRWPVKGGTIFCIRPKNEDGPFVELENVPVLNVQKKGSKLSVILDRTLQNQCEFQSVLKPNKTKPGAHEHIYWRTAEAITANRPKVKIPDHKPQTDITIAISKDEKYAWKFPQYTTTEADIPAGDYALMKDEHIAAVIRRKTLADMLEHFGEIATLDEQLEQLQKSALSAALVIEANYSDFLNPAKQKVHPPEDCARLIAQLQSQHPALPFVYAGNRKLAIEWAHNYFHQAATASEKEPVPPTAPVYKEPAAPPISETPQPYAPAVPQPLSTNTTQSGYLDKLPSTFTAETFGKAFPNVPAAMVKKLLTDLKKRGLVTYKRGKNTLWSKTGSP